MAKYGFEKIESNEVIQSLYKNTGNTQNISLFNEYSKNKYILEALDKKYLSQNPSNQQSNELLNTKTQLKDLQIQLNSKTKKYKLRTKTTTILLIFFILLSIYLFLK